MRGGEKKRAEESRRELRRVEEKSRAEESKVE